MSELIELQSQPISARFGACKDVKEFVQPNTLMVRELLDRLNLAQMSEDDRILACWDWVARNIDYPKDRTTFALTVYGKTIKADDYFLEPSETIAIGLGKCDATSNLLVSMLRNFLSPERVWVVLGDLHSGAGGGHAWVVVSRNSHYDVLETTLNKLPDGNPWKDAGSEAVSLIYDPVLYYNDQRIRAVEDAMMCTLPFQNCKIPWLEEYFCGVCKDAN